MSSQAISSKSLRNQAVSSKPTTQSQIIRRNIDAIAEVQKQEMGRRSTLDRLADSITGLAGSMVFVILHCFWFGFWILLNVGLVKIPRISEFDPFPFGLLTMIVSLEAIFLSTFVLISQNRMARLSEQRAELDLHVNLLAEQKATKALEMLDLITQQLNTVKRFKIAHDPEIEALKQSPEPDEVLNVMRSAVEEELAEAKEEVKKEVTGEIRKAVDEVTGEIEDVREEVQDVTGETRAVRSEVEEMSEEVRAVASQVREVREKVEEPQSS